VQHPVIILASEVMDPLNLQTLARFPILKESSDYIKSLNLSIDDLLENIAYRSAWTRAHQRITETLDYGEIHEPGLTSEAENINELLSYVITRIIISCIKDPYLVRRYALAEAIYAHSGLQNRDIKFISEIAAQFDLQPEKRSENEVSLKLIDYLKYSINLRDPNLKWKLINRDVTHGAVIVNNKDFSRLIQESIRLRILEELPVDVDSELKNKILPRIKTLVNTVQSRKRKFETKDLGKVSITRFPPCIKQLLGMQQAGENLPHVGRFALAAFLHHIGLSSEQILNIFNTSPDFDLDKARYQVEHITGKISGTEYSPPSCETMKSNSICYNPDKLCEKSWMNHPLTYYRIKGKPKKEKIEKKELSERDMDKKTKAQE